MRPLQESYILLEQWQWILAPIALYPIGLVLYGVNLLVGLIKRYQSKKGHAADQWSEI